MIENYHRWNSLYLNRDFEMLTFGERGLPIIIFPTSGGRYYEAKDREIVNSVADLIDDGKIILFCPDSVNNESWYNYSAEPKYRVLRHIEYEKCILNDVIEFAKHKTGFKKVGLAGCSFGAYHAANMTFKHPDKVSHLLTMGGGFDIKQFIFGYYDENCYYNNPLDYLPNLTDDWYLSRIKKINISIRTGDKDFCLPENERLSSILKSKNVDHEFEVRQNTGHDWHWWLDMFRNYILEITKL
jgi:esterase/lipase superfamily enzyme